MDSGRHVITVCFWAGWVTTVLWTPLYGLGFRHLSDQKFLEVYLDCLQPPVPEGPDVVPPDHPLGTVHVVYSESKAFDPLLASMVSLARHLREPGRCNIHLIVDSASMLMAQAVASCFQHELRGHGMSSLPTVTLHELQPMSFNTSDDEWAAGSSTHARGPNTFARFYLHEYLPMAPRVIWMDTDTIIRADIARLYRMPMQHPMAAVTEPLPFPRAYFNGMRDNGHPELAEEIREDLGPKIESKKIQAGVLLLDLERWKSDGIAAKLEALLRRYRGYDNDQLSLNVHFAQTRDRMDAMDEMDWRWNVHALGQFPYLLPRVCRRQARILHFSGDLKPWNPLRKIRRNLLRIGVTLLNDNLYEAAQCNVSEEMRSLGAGGGESV